MFVIGVTLTSPCHVTEAAGPRINNNNIRCHDPPRHAGPLMADDVTLMVSDCLDLSNILKKISIEKGF